MVTAYKAAAEIDVLTSSIPIAHYGQIPVNAFVLRGAEPVLVDTGAVVQSEAFMSALRSTIDPAELSWLWLTHPDPDHIGCLHQLVRENPKLRVVTTFLGVGILSVFAPLPMDRVYLVNPGEKLVLPDRTLTAVKPPVFDNPSTTGFFDDKTRAFFSSDCFGALLPEPPHNAAEISEQQLREGQTLWSTIDAPWIHKVDRSKLREELNQVRSMEPALLLSSHLPAAPGSLMTRLLSNLAEVPAAQPFVGPNQAALQQMLQQMAAGQG
ncbi:MAG TPA: MBL fold metallo-hydrolase [Polyangiaceae bacterium]|nr:MBL fold metallo-hydrolase [Polyangiaceae bacterium]